MEQVAIWFIFIFYQSLVQTFTCIATELVYKAVIICNSFIAAGSWHHLWQFGSLWIFYIIDIQPASACSCVLEMCRYIVEIGLDLLLQLAHWVKFIAIFYYYQNSI
jgi:hypothetical protein